MSYMERRAGLVTGKWVAERTLHGKRHRAKFDTKVAADKWEAVVDATGTLPLDGAGARVAHPLGAVAKIARAERKRWKGSRDKSLDQRLEDVLTFFGPRSPLESITPDSLANYVKVLEARGGRGEAPMSPKTVNRYLSVVSALVSFARERGWSNHAVHFPWQEEGEGRLEGFTAEEEEELLDLLSPANGLCLRVLIATGLRPGEFFNLPASQVSTARNDGAWVRLFGDETKTGKGRSVPIKDFDMARDFKAALEAATLPTHAEFYKALKAACASLGLSETLTVYSTRHSTATRLARVTKPAVVQKWMGHGSYKTTQRYIHLNDEDLLEAAGAL